MGGWKLYSLSDGNTCDNPNMSSEDIVHVIETLQNAFDVEYDNKGIAGLDGVYFDMKIDGYKMTIGWDIWSGLFIMSKEECATETVKAIYGYLDSLPACPDGEKYEKMVR